MLLLLGTTQSLGSALLTLAIAATARSDVKTAAYCGHVLAVRLSESLPMVWERHERERMDKRGEEGVTDRGSFLLLGVDDTAMAR